MAEVDLDFSFDLMDAEDTAFSDSVWNVMHCLDELSSPLKPEESPVFEPMNDQTQDIATSNQAPYSAMSDQTPDIVVSDQNPDTAMSDQTPDTGMSSQTPDTGMSDHVPDTGMSDQTPDIAMSDKTPDTAMSDQNPDTGMSDSVSVKLKFFKLNLSVLVKLKRNKVASSIFK